MRLDDDGVLSPEELRILREAFDEAWLGLKQTVRANDQAVESARSHLARAVLVVARAGPVRSVKSARDAAIVCYWAMSTPSKNRAPRDIANAAPEPETKKARASLLTDTTD